MNPLSGVLTESWALYKAHARHLLTIAFIIYVIIAIVSALLQEIGGFFGLLLGSLVTVVAVFLLQAALVKAVQDVRDGTADLNVGQTFSAATPFIGSVAGASILAGIAITIGFVVLIIPGLFLVTIWCLIVPVIVLEQSGALGSFGRSWQLVKTNFWNVFGTLFLVFVILFVVDIVLGLIFHFAGHLVGNFLGSVIGGTLVAPFIAVVVTLIYFRQSAVTAAPAAAGGPYGAPNAYGSPGTGFPPAGPNDAGFPPPPAPGPADSGFPPSA
jgi:hypothetical protein